MLATESKWTLPPHIDLIDQLLVRVAAGEIKRLIVTVPVRHGKSEMCSRFFPAWLLGMKPDCRVVVAGYGSEFAERWGKMARDLLSEHGQRFFGVGVEKGSRSKSNWGLELNPGGMYSIGVGASLTGRGANVLVIDDPLKNSEEADSETMREKIWDWYWSTARTRLEPRGAIVILMARWHEDDLVGRLLEHPTDIEPWHVVNLPCLAEDNDPLGREPGDALWPERWSRQEMEATRDGGLARWWAALYQQRPAPAEGILFKRTNFRSYRIEDGHYVLRDGMDQRVVGVGECTVFQTCDAAMSDKATADYTVVSTWAIAPTGDLILLDIARQQFESLDVPGFVAGQNETHGSPPIWVETLGAGRVVLEGLRRMGLAGMALKPDQGIQLDKTARAYRAIALYEQHRVFHPQGTVWLAAFESELVSFPAGTNDDQVDTVSYAARLLPTMGKRERVREPAYKPLSAGIMSQRF